jgi:hypothetical protein
LLLILHSLLSLELVGRTLTGVAANGAASRGPVLTRALEQRDETCWSQPPLKERRGTTGEQTTQAEKRKKQESDGARM